MLFKKLIRTAKVYKVQFISMILMIIIGIGIFVGFNIEWKSIEVDTNNFFKETNYADYRLYYDDGFTKDDLEKISLINGIDKATRYLNVNVEIKDLNKSLALNVSENYTVSTMKIIRGKEYDENFDGIYLSDVFAKENKISLNDEITLKYQNLEIPLKVIALVKSSENMICVMNENQLMPDYKNFGFAYISPKTLEKYLKNFNYPQINLCSSLNKEVIEEKIKDSLGRTILVIDKKLHNAYAGAQSEMEEGQTMGSILPVLFLAIAILTMVTTMHRIVIKEKIQIGTLKALGFKDKKIIFHYLMYGLITGIIGSILGIFLGYLIASIIISPKGMMATYFDLPSWDLIMPWFCIPVVILTNLFLILISYLSIKNILKTTPAETLRPYTPKITKNVKINDTKTWKKLSFGTKWNIRDLLRHKSRSTMTLIGIIGCMILLVAGLGMKDTMNNFMDILNNNSMNYQTKLITSSNALNNEIISYANEINADYSSSMGISYSGKTVTLEIYNIENNKIKFIDSKNKQVTLNDEGVYLCLRLRNTAKIGDYIEISPYGSTSTYQVKLVGYLRSVISENIVMTKNYAEKIGIGYKINYLYTNIKKNNIETTNIISTIQDKKTLMDSYDTFMDLLNIMIIIIIFAAIILGIIVLYNLGIMSYIERTKELSTLKVLGFKDKQIRKLLITQNIWLTIIGIIVGIPCGVLILKYLIVALATEYELSLTIGLLTYSISIIITFGTSLLVSYFVSKKNKNIDMVEALKSEE